MRSPESESAAERPAVGGGREEGQRRGGGRGYGACISQRARSGALELRKIARMVSQRLLSPAQGAVRMQVTGPNLSRVRD